MSDLVRQHPTSHTGQALRDYELTLGVGGGIVLDSSPVTIGNHVDIATGVQLLTAEHPLDPARRDSGGRLNDPAQWSPSLDWAFGVAAALGGFTFGTTGRVAVAGEMAEYHGLEVSEDEVRAEVEQVAKAPTSASISAAAILR